MINNKIFNVDKSDKEYQNSSLILGVEPGLFDTINKKYPKIWNLYKEMKSLDWSEDEFSHAQCNLDFKTCPTEVSDMMIRTLAWQWEADSIASRSIITVLAPFITSSELWAAWQRISDNEVVHAATYSEIVRMSFDDPHKVLDNILSVKESLSRLDVVGKVFGDSHKLAHRYAIGDIENDQELYNQVYLTIATLLMLERIQFMASFAITFTICGSGLFQSIGKAVQKIAQDELEVHSELDKEVIRTERKTIRGKIAHDVMADKIKEIFEAIVNSECEWVDYLFSEGRSLVGTNSDIIKSWVLYNAKNVSDFLGIKTDIKMPKINPMPSMEKWLNMNKTQAAPQEQTVAAYKVGVAVRNDDNETFDVDF
jgi:ribonucleoside-diphosphate reductase beta chain